MADIFDVVSLPVLYTVAVVVGVTILLMIFSKSRPKNSPPIAKIGMPIIGNYIEFAKNPVSFALVTT